MSLITELHKEWLESDHVWKLADYGGVDAFVTDHGHHNGPKCTVCGYTACWHCVEVPPPCKPKEDGK